MHDALKTAIPSTICNRLGSPLGPADAWVDVESSTPSAMKSATGFAEPLVSDTPLPIHELCARIHDRIAAFLDAKDVSQRVKNVQGQTREALSVIEEALARYRCVFRMTW